MEDIMGAEIKLTDSRLAEIAAMTNLRIAPTQERAALRAGTRIAIAPVQELATVMANVRLNIQQMVAPFQESINFAVGAVKLLYRFSGQSATRH
jgi:hypothetical protein